MSKAFKCDHCGKYFNRSRGQFCLDAEVCDAKHGYVRYRLVALVFDSSGPPAGMPGGASWQTPEPIPLGSKGNKEFCEDCITLIAKAALDKKKL